MIKKGIQLCFLTTAGANPDPEWAEPMASGAPQETSPQVPAPFMTLAILGLHPNPPLLWEGKTRHIPVGAAMRQSSEQKGNKPEAACDPANPAACLSAVETSRAVRLGRRQMDGPMVILAAIMPHTGIARCCLFLVTPGTAGPCASPDRLNVSVTLPLSSGLD